MSTHDVMSCALPRPSGVVCSSYINGGFFRVLCPRFTFQCSPSCPISVAHDMGSVLASWTPNLSYIHTQLYDERARAACVYGGKVERAAVGQMDLSRRGTLAEARQSVFRRTCPAPLHSTHPFLAGVSYFRHQQLHERNEMSDAKECGATASSLS